MKKIIVILMCVCSVYCCFAQNDINYQLSSTGITTNTSEDYIVINVADSISQNELKKRTQSFLSSKLQVPQSKITDETESLITFNWVSRCRLNDFQKTTVDISYVITFLFKDGKVRINTPFYDSTIVCGGSGTKIALVATFTTPGIFNSNGKVGKKEIKKAVEDNINNFISEYNSFITSSKNHADW